MLVNRTRATQKMREVGLDVLVATSQPNVAYISDYLCVSQRVTPSVQVYGLLPVDEGAPISLVVPSLEVDAWAELPGDVDDVTVYGTVYRNCQIHRDLAVDDQRIVDLTVDKETEENALRALVTALRKHGLSSAAVGIDESQLPFRTWDAICEALPHARIVPAAGVFADIRMVKTEAEIRRLQRSSQITEAAISHLFEHARVGMTERDLARLFKMKVCDLGGIPEFWLVSAGRRTAHTHARQSDYAVQGSDLIKLDVGCTYEFYWSDVGRTKSLGEPSDRATHISEILASGLQAATAAVRAGVRSSEIFEIAVATIREKGLADYDRHHCGHGIGISVYDPPVIQSAGRKGIFRLGDVDIQLEAQMIINLETPYYLIGEFGFILEDTMIVREDGPELLTHLDLSLTI